MNSAGWIAMLVFFAFGLPMLIVSVMSLRYREGKPFQAKVIMSSKDEIIVKYKVKGTVYHRSIPWDSSDPFRPKRGRNVTLEGPLNDPTAVIYSKGGIESSFAIKIVGLIAGVIFTLIGAIFLFVNLMIVILVLISPHNMTDEERESFINSYYGTSYSDRTEDK